jgi:predicted RecA/RadA family phage recombinase
MPLHLTGSVAVLGSVSSSLFGTASWALNVLSSSHALLADTASYAIVSIQSITSSVTNDIVFQAKNNGTDIPAGTPVYISSSNGNNIIVERAQSIDQSQTFALKNELAGVTQTDINGGQSGTVVAFGEVVGIDLSDYNSGDKLWVSQTVGQLTNIAPQPPFDRTFVGIVTKNTNQGQLFVDISQPVYFHDISSVSASLYNSGDLWVYEASASTGIWTNKKSLSGSYQITGSLNTPSITGSLLGTASYALTASYIASGMQIISDTAPSTDYPEATIWFDSSDGTAYTLYSSNGTKQWIGI